MDKFIDVLKSSTKELIVGSIVGILIVLVATYTWVSKQDELTSLRTQVEIYKLLGSHNANVVEKIKNTEALTLQVEQLTKLLNDKTNQVANLHEVIAAKDAELAQLKAVDNKLDDISSTTKELVNQLKQLKQASTKQESAPDGK